MRRLALVACAGVALTALGCGGGSSTTATPAGTTTAAPSTRAVWAAQTQQLCREKQAAIAQLGSVHITFSGIARVGLPTVRRELDAYLTRLLAVLHEFSGRQQQLTTPAGLGATMALARETDLQSQAVTARLRRAVARVRTPAALSTVFRAWIASSQRLAARGDAVARQLGLTGCRSGAATS